MKDYFPEINLLNIAVWPNDSGEVVVNSYNTLLSICENYKVEPDKKFIAVFPSFLFLLSLSMFALNY